MQLRKISKGVHVALPLLTVILATWQNVLLGAPGGMVSMRSEKGQPLGAGEYSRHLQVNGLERSYVLYIPSGLDPAQPAPVILGFHGGFGSPKDFTRVTDLPTQAGNVGFVVVLPEGYRRSWNAGDCCGPAQRQNIDDVTFIKLLLDDLASVVKIDPRRVFATGFSNGGKLSYRLACELSDRIAAIAPVSGSMGVSTCTLIQPVSVLHFHGTADRFAPIEGGKGALGSTGALAPVRLGLETFARENHCTPEPQVVYKRGDMQCETYPNCRGNAEVTLCVIEGMGHQWPGKEILPRLLGPGTKEISATNLVLAFFKKHERGQP